MTGRIRQLENQLFRLCNHFQFLFIEILFHAGYRRVHFRMAKELSARHLTQNPETRFDGAVA